LRDTANGTISLAAVPETNFMHAEQLSLRISIEDVRQTNFTHLQKKHNVSSRAEGIVIALGSRVYFLLRDKLTRFPRIYYLAEANFSGDKPSGPSAPRVFEGMGLERLFTGKNST